MIQKFILLLNYLSNDEETPVEVYMDDFAVTHNGSYVSQATDYGVWGDVLREQKAALDTAYLYRYAYQGKYAEKDEETGWSHFELREYDAVIGRWTAVDPKRQFHSPYIGMGNNPISGTDPNGGFWRPDKDGNLIAEAGDNALTLYKFFNGTKSISEALNIYSNLKNWDGGTKIGLYNVEGHT